MDLIYLDNAATTFPKPLCVTREVGNCIRTYCGNPGRSSHAMAMSSAQKIYECRERIASFFGSCHPENVIFTLNTTYALNIAIKGLLKRGDHVLISDMEHNSVFRPIENLKRKGFIDYSVFKTIENGKLRDADDIIRSVKKALIPQKTRMLICSHVPNICSAVLPIDKIGRVCRDRGIIFALDAAQSAGHLPIDVSRSYVDVLCAPGHKGLFGIQGCGFLLFGDGIMPNPVFEGGNGVSSLEWQMPDSLPERLEAGTLPTPSIASLSEGIAFLSSVGVEEIAMHERRLFEITRDMLLDSPELRATVYLPGSEGSVLLFNLDGIPSEALGRSLAEHGLCVRSGYHCSALGHKALGTLQSGAVRVSFSLFNSEKDIAALISCLKECSRELTR